MPKILSPITFRLFGRQAIIWSLASISANIALALSDYGIAISFQALFKQLGLDSGGAGAEDSLKLFSNWQPQLQLWHLLAVLTLIGIARSLAQLATSQSLALIEEIIRTRLRLISLYEILLAPAGKFVAAAETHTKIGEIYPQAAAFGFLLVNIIAVCLQGLVLLLAAAYIAWRETLAATIGFVLIAGIVSLANRQIRLVALKIPQEQKKLNAGIERIAKNWLLVRTLRTQDREYRSLLENILNYYQHFVRAKFLGNVSAVTPVFFGFIPFIMAIYCSFSFWQTPGLKLVACLFVFSRFLVVFGQLAQKMGMLNRVVPHFKLALAYVSNFSDAEIAQATSVLNSRGGKKEELRGVNLMAEAQGRQPPRANLSWQKLPAKLELKNVSFAYNPDSAPIISNLSLAIAPGEQIGIVGKSGSGKSTLLGLIIGVIQPNGGSIMVGNLTAAEFFEQPSVTIGYVGSEPFLFEGTIRDNLNYGSGRIYAEREYYQALEMARLWDAIAPLPAGLDYRLSENGEGLSTGQKQRLCLARALLGKPQILLLDEVSANLDEETELEIAHSVSQLKGVCTVLIASHRPSILQFADRIVNLANETEQPLRDN